MNVKPIAEMVRRQYLIILAVLAAGLALYLVALPVLRKYQAISTVLSVAGSNADAAPLDPRRDPTQSAVTQKDLPTLLTSQAVLDQVSRKLHLTSTESEKLYKQIKAKPVFDSDVLPITFTDRSADRAVAGANAVTQALAEYNKTIATRRYDALIGDLSNQLDVRRAKLQIVDSQIAKLSSEDPYVTPDTGTTALNTQLVALEAQRNTVEATMRGDAAAATLAAARPALSKALAGREIVQNDPVVDALKTQYGKDLAQYNLQKAGYTEKYPGLPGLADQVGHENASLNATVAQETSNPAKSSTYVSTLLDANKARGTLAADRAQLGAIQNQITGLLAHLSSSHSAGTAMSELKRDRTVQEASYGELSTRLANAQADRAQAGTIDSLVVIDRATSATPTTLSQPVVLGAAFTIAFLWLAFTLAFLFDGADNRLRSTDSIEDLYGRPVFTPVG